MDPSVQEVVQELLVRPIHAIGPKNSKLLEYLKEYPEGAETLILKILSVFTEGSRPTPNIVTLVKGLVADRGADARFLMLIIGEMDKVIIIVYVSLSILIFFTIERNSQTSTEDDKHLEWNSGTKNSCTTNVQFHSRADATNEYQSSEGRAEQAFDAERANDPVARHGSRGRPEKGKRR
jgi:hypothetical protein